MLMQQEDNWENKLQKELERQIRVVFFKAAAALNISSVNKGVGKLFR